MDKEQLLAAFNEHFKEFVDDIRRVFPKNIDIVALSKGLPGVLLLNPKMIIKAFKTNFVDIYRVNIEQGDINFFINLDYKKDLTNLGMDGDKCNMILEKIECLKEPVRLMNTTEQDNVLKYMKNLMGLNDLDYSN